MIPNACRFGVVAAALPPVFPRKIAVDAAMTATAAAIPFLIRVFISLPL
jgi:hypothetical protein